MAQILVVDDEIGIRELLSEILSDEGHQVMLAENAGAARVLRSRQRPDLVLLDIWMPDTDGITLLKEWAATGQLTMPVVMMSGHGTIDTAVEATRIGALDYLEKPIALQRLLATVKRALRNQEVAASPRLALSTLGRSPVLAELKKRLAQLAQAGAPLMLRGERGMHPELFARHLLAAGAPFVSAPAALSEPPSEVLAQAGGGILFVPELARLARTEQKNLEFLLVYCCVGFVFALLVFAVSVVSIPLMLDRNQDAVTSMLASIRALAENPLPLLVWAALIVGLTLLGFMSFHIGLAVLMPVVGHATWHAYRELVEPLKT